MNIETRYRIVVLRILAHLLIKVSAGKGWGCSETQAASFANDALELVRELDGQND